MVENLKLGKNFFGKLSFPFLIVFNLGGGVIAKLRRLGCYGNSNITTAIITVPTSFLD